MSNYKESRPWGIFENLLDGSEHFALIKGKIKKGIVPRVRVISSNVVQNYLLNQNLPNSFNKTLNYFKKYNNCVLIFIRDTNLKSVTQTLRDYKSNSFYKKIVLYWFIWSYYATQPPVGTVESVNSVMSLGIQSRI